MDSYVVRIYRRAGRRSRLLVGTIEAAGAGRKMAFSNIDELWEILGHRQDRGPFPPPPRRRLRKEVMSATTASDSEESAEGLRQIKPT